MTNGIAGTNHAPRDAHDIVQPGDEPGGDDRQPDRASIPHRMVEGSSKSFAGIADAGAASDG